MDNWIPNLINFVVLDGNGKVIEGPGPVDKALSYSEWLASPTLREPYVPTSSDLLQLRAAIKVGVADAYKEEFAKALQASSTPAALEMDVLRLLWDMNWRQVNGRNVIRKHPYMK
jgi:hypothetical protein